MKPEGVKAEDNVRKSAEREKAGDYALGHEGWDWG